MIFLVSSITFSSNSGLGKLCTRLGYRFFKGIVVSYFDGARGVAFFVVETTPFDVGSFLISLGTGEK